MNRFTFYSRIYDQFMKLFGLYKREDIHRALEGIKGGKLLDIAGGTGYVVSHYQDRFEQIIIVDTSPGMLAIAAKRKLEGCLSSALSLPFKDESFDTILCTDALHHIKAYAVALPEMYRVLKPGGVIIIQEMHIRGIKGVLFYLWEKIWIDNSRFITPDALLTQMNQLGFKGHIRCSNSLEYFYQGTKK